MPVQKTSNYCKLCSNLTSQVPPAGVGNPKASSHLPYTMPHTAIKLNPEERKEATAPPHRSLHYHHLKAAFLKTPHLLSEVVSGSQSASKDVPPGSLSLFADEQIMEPSKSKEV